MYYIYNETATAIIAKSETWTPNCISSSFDMKIEDCAFYNGLLYDKTKPETLTEVKKIFANQLK